MDWRPAAFGQIMGVHRDAMTWGCVSSSEITSVCLHYYASIKSLALYKQVCYLDKHTDVQFSSTVSTQHTNTDGFSITKRNNVLRWTQLPWQMRSSGALRSEWRYHYSPRNAPEEHSSHLLHGRSLKPPNTSSLPYCSDLPQHYHAKGLRYSERPGVAHLFKHSRIT